MAFGFNTRRFIYQNATSGNVYEVFLGEASNGAVSGVARTRGANKFNSDPTFDDTEITFVVVTAQLSKVFGTAALTDPALTTAAIYHATLPGGTGVALSTLLT